MNRVLAQVHPAWSGRTRREQRMLAVLGLLVAAVALWLAVVRPVIAWRAEAARDRASAERDLSGVRASLARLASVTHAPERAPDAQGLEPVVLRTAEAAGLEITTGMDASGRLGFQVAAAPARVFFGWLADLETTHGLQPSSLGVVKTPDGSLQAEGGF